MSFWSRPRFGMAPGMAEKREFLGGHVELEEVILAGVVRPPDRVEARAGPAARTGWRAGRAGSRQAASGAIAAAAGSIGGSGWKAKSADRSMIPPRIRKQLTGPFLSPNDDHIHRSWWTPRASWRWPRSLISLSIIPSGMSSVSTSAPMNSALPVTDVSKKANEIHGASDREERAPFSVRNVPAGGRDSDEFCCGSAGPRPLFCYPVPRLFGPLS